MSKTPKTQPEKQMDANVSLKLPQELLDKARAKSKDTGVSISFILRKAIKDWVETGRA
jgi:predicted DNA-binding protein